MSDYTSSPPLTDLLTFMGHRDDHTHDDLSDLANVIIFGSSTTPGPDGIEILPNQIAEMYTTKVAIIPSALILLISCSMLIFTIFTYFKRVIKLYIGLVFYSVTEVLLFLRILLVYLLSEALPCGVTKSLTLFTMTLPILAILLITISRLIFIKYPLRYRNILLIKYQVVACVVAVIFALLIALWPALGACQPYYDTILGFCHLECDSICYGYIAVYVTLGILLPTLVVIGIYIYVYNVLKKHRERAQNRKNSLPGNNDQSPGGRKCENSKSGTAAPEKPRVKVCDLNQAGITIVNKVSLTIDKDALNLNNISIHTETNLIFTNNNGTIPEDQIKEDKSAKSDSDVVVTNFSVVTPKELSAFVEKEHKKATECSQNKGSHCAEERQRKPSNGIGDLLRFLPWEKSPLPLTVHGDLQPPEHGTVLTNPLHSSSEVETWQSKKFSLQCPSSANLLSTDWHKRKESAKPHDLRSIKPLFKEAVRRLSLVTEQTDLLRKKEIPWSLVLLTLIHITSSIPWIFILVSQDSIGMIASESGRVWLDLGNALLLCSVAISPLLYVLFTRLIRDKVWQIIKNMFKAMFGI